MTSPPTTLRDGAVAVDMAMTVRQAWGFAIAAGFKPVENRGAMCNYLGTVALHTSRTLSGTLAGFGRLPTQEATDALQAAGAMSGTWDPAEPGDAAAGRDPRLALGALIAVVDIVGCHRVTVTDGVACCYPWGEKTHRGPSGKIRTAVHIELANPRVLETPIPERGQPLQLWRLPAATAELLAVSPLRQPSQQPFGA
jgi:hypothetical protein